MKETGKFKNQTGMNDGVIFDDPFWNDIFSHHASGGAPLKKHHWSIAWSDLMMTMFILFAVMYMIQTARTEAIPEPSIRKEQVAVSVHQAIPEISNEGRGSFPEIYARSRQKMPDSARVDLVSDTAVRITLTNDLLFETGSADLKTDARKILSEVASILKENDHFINIAGHTDNRPIHTKQFPSNWELSALRACAVARFLSDNFDIRIDRFFVTGHAANSPLQPNITVQNRAMNRRVEIMITRQKP